MHSKNMFSKNKKYLNQQHQNKNNTILKMEKRKATAAAAPTKAVKTIVNSQLQTIK